MKLIHAAPIILIATAGCASTQMRPDKPPVMMPATQQAATSENPLFPYTLVEFNKDYGAYREYLQKAAEKAAEISGDPANDAKLQAIYRSATVQRNVMINRVRADIHANAGEFEDTLRDQMAKFETGADFAELALAAATAITGGEHAKTVLAAVLTAAKGAHTAVSKNFYMEQTSKAVVAVLRSSRRKADLAIVGKMTDNRADQYTFEEAWTDLVDLYYAGTLASGFQQLTETTGAEAEKTKNQQENLDKDRSTTLRAATVTAAANTDDVSLARRIGRAIAGKSQADLGRIAAAMNIQAAGDNSAAEAMKSDIFQSLSDPRRMSKYKDAFDAVFGKENW